MNQVLKSLISSSSLAEIGYSLRRTAPERISGAQQARERGQTDASGAEQGRRTRPSRCRTPPSPLPPWPSGDDGAESNFLSVIEVLATAGVIAGKRITTVPKCQFDAEVCGATYVGGPVVVVAQLVTARGSRDGWQWMQEFIKLLNAWFLPPTDRLRQQRSVACRNHSDHERGTICPTNSRCISR